MNRKQALANSNLIRTFESFSKRLFMVENESIWAQEYNMRTQAGTHVPKYSGTKLEKSK